MATDFEKDRRMELRRGLGNRGFGAGLKTSNHRGPPYLVAHACFLCRKSFKTTPRKSEECTCPTCGGSAYEMGRSFRAPARSQVEQWLKVQLLFALGFRFFSYRTFDCAPLPKKLCEVDRFVQEHPDHPFRIRGVRHDLMPG